MAHLLNVWPSVRAKLSQQDNLLLLFDYDGTLAPIRPRPEEALLPQHVREKLASLSALPGCVVGIISGRGLSDLVGLTGSSDLILAGNHGMEIRGPGLEFIHPEAVSARTHLAYVASKLSDDLTHIPGAFVEDKGLTLTVHFRTAPQASIQDVEAAVGGITGQFVTEGKLKVTRGKMVLEVRPDIPWDKGRAIEKISEEHGDRNFPMYFGDDRTDEDGFVAVQRLNGLAVFVGEPRAGTVALHQLDSPEEVWMTLDLLLDQRREMG